TVRRASRGAAREGRGGRVGERRGDAVSGVGGVVRMRRGSRAEISEILLEFEWGSKLAFLVQDVRERLDRVFLPQGVERPLILRYDPSLDPILRIALSSRNSDLVRLRDLAEQEVERELEGLQGVAAVKVRGGLEDEIQVRIDPQRLAAFRLTPELVRQRLTEENLNVPGGTVEEGAVEYVVRTLNEFRSLEEMEELPLVLRGSTTVKLRDVATVARTHKDRDVILRVAGDEAVEIDVYREAGANIVEVAAAVRQKLLTQPPSREELMRQARAQQEGRPYRRAETSIEQKLPSDMKLTILSDQSLFVKGAIDEVREAAIAGGLLAVLVCFLFLRKVGVTAIIGLAIPVSIVATFGAMYVAGVSMNVMSLGGLALGIGMLVDNAIVVLESINRCREEGDPPMQAAVRGVSEVGSAVTASTMTTIAVFAPIVFVEGIAGQTFGDQSLTVVASLLLSLAVALFFIPGLAARLDRQPATGAGGGPGAALAPPAPRLMPRSRTLLRGLRWPKRWILWLVVALLAAAAGALLMSMSQAELAPHLAKLKAAGGPRPGVPGIPDAVKEKASMLQIGGSALLLPLLWLLGEPLLVILSRIAADALGLLFFGLRWVGLALFLPLWLVLQVPAWIVDRLQKLLERAYPAFLRRALHAPLLVILLVAGLAWSAWVAAGSLGRELLPEVLQGEMTAELYFPAGYPLEETDRLATRLEAKLAAIDGVIESAAISGADRESTSSEEDGPHVAHITVRTRPGDDARRVEVRVERAIREVLLAEPALARFELRRPTLLALKAPLEIEVLGDDLEELELIALDIERRVPGRGGVVRPRRSPRPRHPPGPVIRRRAPPAAHGLVLGPAAPRARAGGAGRRWPTAPADAA
ncbi:MAG: efflux RND transporter permease subunit, partial [Planctomycetes bacterium]|nr:efflux RND transporter permease subunit [Planctomycetota bacterium]